MSARAPLARVVIALAAVKLALHLASTGAWGYGFFVDELYFLALSDHLAWGSVDVPPLFPALTALLRASLGDSLFAVRLLPTLAGVALVLLAGALSRRLGGGAFAQGMASLAVIAAPIFLVMHSIHTMNALEPLLWTGGAYLLVRLLDGEDPRLWLGFGALCGVGMLNKHSMAFFGVALIAGLIAAGRGRLLATRWPWLGGLLAVFIYAPNLIWDAAHGFPHLEMLAFIRMHGRDMALGPGEFMAQQALMLHPLALPVWGAGLLWLLAGRYRALGIGYVVLIAEMILLGGRPYYPAPYYPILLAAGGVALERALSAWPRTRLAYAGVLAVAGAILAPLFAPLLPPEALVRYSRALGISQPRIEMHRLGALPQLMADRFGWPEMAGEVARVYHALPPEERRKAAIFAQNYGQAGAIDRFGPALGLPRAVSGHLTYHAWGPRDYTGEVLVVMDGDQETLENICASVERAGRVRHPWSMPYENFDVFVCRGLREPLPVMWPRLRNFG